MSTSVVDDKTFNNQSEQFAGTRRASSNIAIVFVERKRKLYRWHSSTYTGVNALRPSCSLKLVSLYTSHCVNQPFQLCQTNSRDRKTQCLRADSLPIVYPPNKVSRTVAAPTFPKTRPITAHRSYINILLTRLGLDIASSFRIISSFPSTRLSRFNLSINEDEVTSIIRSHFMHGLGVFLRWRTNHIVWKFSRITAIEIDLPLSISSKVISALNSVTMKLSNELRPLRKACQLKCVAKSKRWLILLAKSYSS